MKVQGAVIKEQGITFAIVVVKKHIVDSSKQSEETIYSFSQLFPGMPIVLMAQDTRGIPKYRGRYPKKCPDCGAELVYKTGGEYTTTEV